MTPARRLECVIAYDWLRIDLFTCMLSAPVADEVEKKKEKDES